MSSSEMARAATRWFLALSALSFPALAACPPEDCGELAPTAPGSSGVQVRVGVPILRDLPLLGAMFTSVAPDAHQSSTVQIVQSDGGHTYSVKIQDGKTSATIDDKPVPEDRIRRRGDKVELLDDKGEVAATLALPDLGGGRAGLTLRLGDDSVSTGRLRFQRLSDDMLLGDAAAQAGQDAAVAIAKVQTPPVMLGITMGKPGEGTGVMVDSVLDGLPAAKAGIKVGDRITKFEGKEVVGRSELRKSLMDFKPGQEVTLEVQREGKTQEIKLKLDAFESKRLEPAAAAWRDLNNPYAGAAGHDEAWYKDALKKIEDAQQKLKDSKLTDDARRLADQALEQACKSLQEAQEKAKDAAQRAEEAARVGANNWLNGQTKVFGGQRGGVYVAPAPFDEEAMDRRLGEMERKMERLLARLDAGSDRGGDERSRIADLEKQNRELQRQIEELRKKSGGN